MQRSFSIFDVLVVLFLLVVLTLLVAPVYVHPHGRAPRVKCASNLRQLGLAAVQYGDDKRFLPHVRAIKDLDGGATTSDTPRSVRALVWYGYHDNPEGFICPSSVDMHVPITTAEVLDNMRLWGWQASYGEPDSPRNTTPPWRDGAAGGDETLAETHELSYAYTRRGYNRNVSSLRILGADRGLSSDEEEPSHTLGRLANDHGNHSDGWNVVKADATVQFVGWEEELNPGESAHTTLTGTGRKQGFLALNSRDRPSER